MIKRIVQGLLLLYIIILMVYISTPARNNPETILKKQIRQKAKNKHIPEKLRVVCIGDSITHGNVSANYVKALQKQLEEKIFQKTGKKFETINAGINSELVYNVLNRIDPIAALCPDFITILIGTNDCYGSSSLKLQKRYRFTMKLPELPTPNLFETHLNTLIEQLKEKTDAEIGIFSLPTITEVSSHPLFERCQEFSRKIKQIADNHGIAYFPLNEQMTEKIIESPQSQRKWTLKYFFMTMVFATLYYFVYNWNFVGKWYGLRYHSDNLHLNNRGIEMVLTHLKPFILNNLEDS